MKAQIDIEIDKLTNSIENTITGEVFDTIITKLELDNIKQVKKKDWVFNWADEIRDATKSVYKLTTVNNEAVIQGLLSVEAKEDHVFMHLIENANFNKGRNKMYFGIPGNLVAFACKLSFTLGYEGYIVFDAKTALIKHYEETLGARHFRGLRMFIETKAATKLVERYFKD